MIFQKPIFFALLNLLVVSVDSFVISNPSYSVTCPHSSKPSTCLRAEEDNETEIQSEETAAAGDDILNSPAFLKRKIDVLKSDIAKAEEDIEAATALAEAGKAEWAPQLEDLQREVSHSFFFYTTVLLSSFYVSYNTFIRFLSPFLSNFNSIKIFKRECPLKISREIQWLLHWLLEKF